MNLTDLSAHEARRLFQKRSLSPVELTKAYLDKIRQQDHQICAYITVNEEEALQMAEKACEMILAGDIHPVTGIPLALKDLLLTKGQLTTCGSKMLETFVPPADASAVSRLREAGAVFLGKTNMDEFAMGSSTENSRFFPTKNPWDLTRVPGGSSGGSAAAVSAGEALIALGSDTGGSIRQPAAFCGISGLKPTYGSVSRYGLVAFASSLDQIGPMAKDVKDLALCLSVITGKDPKDSTTVEHPNSNFIEAVNSPSIKGLKIGRPVNFFGEGLDSHIAAALQKAQETLQDLGAEFVDIILDKTAYSLAAYYIIAPAEASSNLARFDGVRYGYREEGQPEIETMYKKTRREAFGEEVLRRIMTGTYALSAGYYDAYYLKAQKVRTLIRQDFEKAFEKCQAIFAPVTPSLPFKIGEKTQDPLSMYLSDVYTVSVNLTGLPGLSIPCGFHEGLPIGMQLIGKAFDESTLLKIGSAYQQTTDYHTKSPPL